MVGMFEDSDKEYYRALRGKKKLEVSYGEGGRYRSSRYGQGAIPRKEILKWRRPGKAEVDRKGVTVNSMDEEKRIHGKRLFEHFSDYMKACARSGSDVGMFESFAPSEGKFEWKWGKIPSGEVCYGLFVREKKFLPHVVLAFPERKEFRVPYWCGKKSDVTRGYDKYRRWFRTKMEVLTKMSGDILDGWKMIGREKKSMSLGVVSWLSGGK